MKGRSKGVIESEKRLVMEILQRLKGLEGSGAGKGVVRALKNSPGQWCFQHLLPDIFDRI